MLGEGCLHPNKWRSKRINVKTGGTLSEQHANAAIPMNSRAPSQQQLSTGALIKVKFMQRNVSANKYRHPESRAIEGIGSDRRGKRDYLPV